VLILSRIVHRPATALTALAMLVGVVGCASSSRQPPAGAGFQMGPAAAMARAKADSARLPYTQADIDFMRGMIHHHAQAIVISRWAPSRGASPALQRLTARIINAQTDEIALMQTWLGDRNQVAPTLDSAGNVSMGMAGHAMAGHDMSSMGGAAATVMPGMLTDAQMKELDAARGTEFDRLFLGFMIQHHRGAVSMVRTLFSSRGAGQDETVFKFASDVEVDQSTEIRRMLSMMLEMGFMPPPG
jgi:uncharacterized protein (DUF305 family)